VVLDLPADELPLLRRHARLIGQTVVTGVTLETLNDWNFSNRAFIGALFPFIAAELDADLPQ
jgi:hypothetical protein